VCGYLNVAQPFNLIYFDMADYAVAPTRDEVERDLKSKLDVAAFRKPKE
jgi:hypothetical protein